MIPMISDSFILLFITSAMGLWLHNTHITACRPWLGSPSRKPAHFDIRFAVAHAKPSITAAEAIKFCAELRHT
jgi:hypothetical protein